MPCREAWPVHTVPVSAAQRWCGRDRIRTCVGEAGGFTGRTGDSPLVPSHPRPAPLIGCDVHKRHTISFRRHWASPPVPPCPARPAVGRREGGGNPAAFCQGSVGVPARQARGTGGGSNPGLGCRPGASTGATLDAQGPAPVQGPRLPTLQGGSRSWTCDLRAVRCLPVSNSARPVRHWEAAGMLPVFCLDGRARPRQPAWSGEPQQRSPRC